MEQSVDLLPPARALSRIQALSRPMTLLISIALTVAVMVPLAQIVVMLFFADRLGSLHGYLSFSDWGVGLSIGSAAQDLAAPTQVSLELLTLGQRCAVAALAAVCALCGALALLQLRGLFALYSRGLVFTAANILRIKRFGLWLVAAAVAANAAGRLFVLVTHTPASGTANAALAVVLGVMIYVIAHVMELGREADLERKDFI